MSNKIYVTRQKRDLGHANAYLLLRRAVNTALSAEGAEASCEVNVMLTDDEGIREINRKYREIDAVTDVLSFPFNELTPGKFDGSSCEKDPETGRVLLGDMVLSIPRCELQGDEFGHGFEREICYLAVHSTLHLLGYDHMDEAGEKRLMRSKEKKIMERLSPDKSD